MPTRAFSFVEGGPKRLWIRWSDDFDETRIELDDTEILKIVGRSKLASGQSVSLKEEGTLYVALDLHGVRPTLEVLRNGFPVPGSSTHPDTAIGRASSVLFAIAAISIIGGIATLENGATGADLLGILAVGALFALLAALTQRKKRWALIAGLALYALDTLGTVALLFMGGGSIGLLLGFIWRAVAFVVLVRGIEAFEQARKDPNAAVDVFR